MLLFLCSLGAKAVLTEPDIPQFLPSILQISFLPYFIYASLCLKSFGSYGANHKNSPFKNHDYTEGSYAHPFQIRPGIHRP